MEAAAVFGDGSARLPLLLPHMATTRSAATTTLRDATWRNAPAGVAVDSGIYVRIAPGGGP